ncbi:hypothetical protein RKD23_007749 [Streptomyces sp. SAI-170]
MTWQLLPLGLVSGRFLKGVALEDLVESFGFGLDVAEAARLLAP